LALREEVALFAVVLRLAGVRAAVFLLAAFFLTGLAGFRVAFFAGRFAVFRVAFLAGPFAVFRVAFLAGRFAAFRVVFLAGRFAAFRVVFRTALRAGRLLVFLRAATLLPPHPRVHVCRDGSRNLVERARSF
jgi:hypothetical protein